MLELAMREVLAVATAYGVLIDETHVTDAMAFIDALPKSATMSLQRTSFRDGLPSSKHGMVQ